MTKLMLINAMEEEESRVAVLKDGVLQELYIERHSMATCLGNIYKGRVVNIEPSIEAAFVDLGGARNGFLHVSDLNPGLVAVSAGGPAQNGSPISPAADGGPAERKPPDRRTERKINRFLDVGTDLLVQVSKDGIADKGPTLTTYISLPGRFLVLMPGTSKQGVSRKIEDPAERERLKTLIMELDPARDQGVIVRTAGANQIRRELQRDFRYLTNIWTTIQGKCGSVAAPALLYQENDLVVRVLRDVLSTEFAEVLVDTKEVCAKAKEFMEAFMPRQADKVRLYKGSRPLFDRYRIEKEVESALHPRIPLRSGGSLFIEQTEALVAIDVNSGKFKGSALEETALAINIEASKEIARQLRLRDLGGLIVIDFIDMQGAEHKRTVEREFREALREDRARIKLARISPFGVIELTRQRLRPSLERTMYEKCSHCAGTGYVATSETIGLRIMRRIRLWVTQSKNSLLKVTVNDRMAEYIQNSKRRAIHSLEESFQKKIVIAGDTSVPLDAIVLGGQDAPQAGQRMLFDERGF